MDYTALSAYAGVAAAIGQVVAAIVVIVSLMYLARQLRDNTKAMLAAAYHANVANTVAIITPLVTDPEYARFVQQCMKDPSSVSELDQFRWHSRLLMSFRHYDNLFYQYRLGCLEEGQWKGYEATLDGWLQYPGYRSWFEKNKQIVSEDLRVLVSAKIAATRQKA